MKRGNRRPLTPKLQAELDALAAMPESEIDTTDMPPITNWNIAVRGPLPARPGTGQSTSAEVHVPNRETIAAIEAGERGEVFRASSIEELMADLKSDD